MKQILITGGAGFIGYHVVEHLLQAQPKSKVVAIDNLNSYYDLSLKQSRIQQLEKYVASGRLMFKQLDIVDDAAMKTLFDEHDFSTVIHLAAQAGVRYARENPQTYIETNVQGFFNVIDNAARTSVSKFIYASSSSVYGANTKMPFQESDKCSSPMSLYAATKMSNEMIAASYYFTHNLKTVGLRFFNVYGPWGRPDMAYYKWTKDLLDGKPIELRNGGEMFRDMTYIADVVQSISRLVSEYDWEAQTHTVFNVGNKNPVKILDMLECLKTLLNVHNVELNYVEKGSEEPIKTFADTQKLEAAIGFSPNTTLREGLSHFVNWYRSYNGQR